MLSAIVTLWWSLSLCVTVAGFELLQRVTSINLSRNKIVNLGTLRPLALLPHLTSARPVPQQYWDAVLRYLPLPVPFRAEQLKGVGAGSPGR